MDLIPINSCNKLFNFEPSQNFSLLPVAWERYLLTYFEKSLGKDEIVFTLNFSKKDISFSHLFFKLYPSLSLLELAKLVQIILKLSTDLQTQIEKDFLPLYGIGEPKGNKFYGNEIKDEKKYTEDQNDEKKVESENIGNRGQKKSIPKMGYDKDLIKSKKLGQNVSLLLSLLDRPLKFQNWLSEKKVHFSKIKFLKCVKDLFFLDDIFYWIGEHSPTHAQGLLILEWALELFLIEQGNKKWFDLFPEAKNFRVEEMFLFLEKKRKPMSYNRDSLIREKLKKIICPLGVHVIWERRGDETGFKFTIWSKDERHLQKQLKRVEEMKLFKALIDKP